MHCKACDKPVESLDELCNECLHIVMMLVYGPKDQQEMEELFEEED